jgi:hypothetical protein
VNCFVAMLNPLLLSSARLRVSYTKDMIVAGGCQGFIRAKMGALRLRAGH